MVILATILMSRGYFYKNASQCDAFWTRDTAPLNPSITCYSARNQANCATPTCPEKWSRNISTRSAIFLLYYQGEDHNNAVICKAPIRRNLYSPINTMLPKNIIQSIIFYNSRGVAIGDHGITLVMLS